jgi:hypothetical protein
VKTAVFVFLMAIIPAICSAGDYYKWQDEKGHWHYTNMPPMVDNAQNMNMSDDYQGGEQQNNDTAVNANVSQDTIVAEAIMRKERIWINSKIEKAVNRGRRRGGKDEDMWRGRLQLLESDPIVYFEMKKEWRREEDMKALKRLRNTGPTEVRVLPF